MTPAPRITSAVLANTAPAPAEAIRDHQVEVQPIEEHIASTGVRQMTTAYPLSSSTATTSSLMMTSSSMRRMCSGRSDTLDCSAFGLS